MNVIKDDKNKSEPMAGVKNGVIIIETGAVQFQPSIRFEDDDYIEDSERFRDQINQYSVKK